LAEPAHPANSADSGRLPGSQYHRAAPGRRLVLVKYLPGHVVHDEWVYNQPDIDSSRIVWTRDLGPG
jgi:hypothetical protein